MVFPGGLRPSKLDFSRGLCLFSMYLMVASKTPHTTKAFCNSSAYKFGALMVFRLILSRVCFGESLEVVLEASAHEKSFATVKGLLRKTAKEIK